MLLCLVGGGGVPHPRVGGVPRPGLDGGGVPHPRSGVGGTQSDLDGGEGDTPSQGRGV